MSNVNYYNWFKKVINFCIYFFFIFSLISNLCLYSSVFSEIIKYVVFVVVAAAYLLVVKLFKDKVKDLLNKLFVVLSKASYKKLLVIILLTSIVLKAIAYLFFFFDSTLGGGDITIYANLADRIINNGLSSARGEIYYLVGMASHLAIFKSIGIPMHLGVYISFLLGTIINFFSFKEIIGKEKAFVVIMLYMLMPSTSMLTFCCTHELFVYLYFSIILFALNRFIKSSEIKSTVISVILLFVFITLNQLVSPIGKIWFIVIGIIALLTNLDLKKKIIIVCVALLSFGLVSINTNDIQDNVMSQSNNIEQLLIGANIESGGHHTDHRGKEAAKKYWEERGVELTIDNLVEGEKGALIETYKYLFTHPFQLLKLLSSKFFTAWSGDVYSVELGYAFGGYGQLAYMVMLLISSVIWLFVITLGVFFYKKNEDEISINNYKLIILGIMAVLLIVEIANKYSCYMTMFIYFVAVSRAKLLGGNENE